MRPQSRWTDQAVDLLRSLAANGIGYRDIAHEIRATFGIPITRNSVCGKSFRMKISNHVLSNQAKAKLATPRKRERKRKNLSTKLAFLARTPAPALVPDHVVDVNDASHRKSILELTNATCRWPIGNPKAPDFAYCGAPGADLNCKRPYCPAHEVMAWRDRHG